MPPTVPCPRCGASNRLDATRLEEGLRMVGTRGNGEVLRALVGVG